MSDNAGQESVELSCFAAPLTGTMASMTTTSRLPDLCSSLLRTSSVVLGLALCASAWANPGDKNVVASRTKAAESAPPAKRVQYYMHSSASAIPVPIEQLEGAFPTTTRPLVVIGRRHLVER